jgi:3-oxoacyl-[acyl-carrier protein] reductase
MAAKLDGRIALVTGSGNGMGRSHAIVLAERGADVVVHDIEEAAAAETAAMVRAKGRRAHLLIADIRDVKTFVAGVEGAMRALGGVSILVNNAGIGGQGLKVEDIDIATFDNMFSTHVRGAFFAVQAVLPSMKAQRYGRIVNISSTFAMGGFHIMSHYAGAKAAISGMTRSWAREFAPHGITVNAVAPGTVETRITLGSLGRDGLRRAAEEAPLGRIPEAVDISYAVAWLASDEARFVTGQLISPNAGQVIGGA